MGALTETTISPEDWERHERVKRNCKIVVGAFLELGKDLWETKTKKAYLNWNPTFESYLAEHTGQFSRATAYMVLRIWDVFVQRLDIDQTLLLEAGQSKLDYLQPHVTEDNADELVNMAATLSRSDLRDMLNQMFGPDATPPLAKSDDIRVECPKCGQRFDAKGYIVPENGKETVHYDEWKRITSSRR